MRTLRSRLLIPGVFLLILVLAMTLAACGGKGPEATTPEVTTPEVTTPPSSYSITFRVNGVDHTSEVPVGEMPIFEGSTLRPSDDANTYRFIGWDKEIAPATAETVYTAVYETLALVTYDVKWNFSGGLYSTTVKEGHAPTPPAEFRETYSTADTVYTFTAWDKSFEVLTPAYMEGVQGEFLVFNAKYDRAARTYAVTFKYHDQVVATEQVAYGERPTAPDASNVIPAGYNGIAWLGLTEVTGDMTIEGVAAMQDPDILAYALDMRLISFSSTAGDNDNRGNVTEEASSLLYLAMEVRAAASLDGDTKLALDRVVEHLKYFVGEEGVRPFFDLEPYWCYVPLTGAISVCKETPAIWDQLTEAEKEKYDFIMKCFAYILTFGTADGNNYKTGPGLAGNFSKTWNPNYRMANVIPMIFVGQYFGGANAVDEILLAFSYDEVMAKFAEYGFDRALARWENKRAEIAWDTEGNPTAYGPYVKELLEGGGTAYLKARNDSTGDRLELTEGKSAGSGVGVRTAYTYGGYRVDDVNEILKALFKYNYSGGPVVDRCCYNEATGEYRAYIIDGKSSPYLGLEGMMRELGLETSRSSCAYGSHDFMLVVSTLAAANELGIYNIEDPANADVLYLAWIGNADFMFKYETGYMSWASSGGEASKLTVAPAFPSSYHMWKSWWNGMYGDYTPETLPEYVAPFDPAIKSEDYEEANINASVTTGNVTNNGITYGTNKKDGVTMKTGEAADGTNRYLIVNQTPGSGDPTINLTRDGGLAKALGEYTAVTFQMDLAIPEGGTSISGVFRLRGKGGTKDTVAIFDVSGNAVTLLGGVKLGDLTTEFQTLTVTVDFATGTLVGMLGNNPEITTTFAPSSGSEMTNTAEWLSTINSYIFNFWIKKNNASSDKTLYIDNLTVSVAVPEEE